MSKLRLGKKGEKKVKDILKKEGYLVDQKPHTKWQSKDFFNMFDIIAIKGYKIRFIQVKTTNSKKYTTLSSLYNARKKISKFLIKNKLGIRAEIWVVYNKLDKIRKEKYYVDKGWIRIL